ncbi:protein O-linked-mannose beta-1,2-N-acetylglucosaminyltransferase 1-like [Dysidea avara]|uniref:protein O-linked-mannose beta-1,2-N-acetylglucosaminyltransferase 1-like n=1 Tax=Dysidea avara TaxID=196820 RepID=UPI0033229F5B
MRGCSHSKVKGCFCCIIFTTVLFIMIISRVRIQFRQYWCDWPDTVESRRREEFCFYMESYFEDVCRCDDPVSINIIPKPLFHNQLQSTPVAIVATDRAQSLYRTLHALLSAPGANPSLITVFLDGVYSGPIFVAQLFNIRVESHTMDLASPSDLHDAPEQKRRKLLKERIDQHYKFCLDRIFELFPTANQAIILEDDLQVSPDFFSYFNQTSHLLHEDESLYCISAWNDFSYKHSSRDPTLLYRVDTMPGLGWMLTRNLYEELRPKWLKSSEPLTWDGWLREPAQRKGRECIMPDVCRTFHFTTGVHISEYQQHRHFDTHSFNDERSLHLFHTEDLTKDAYEEVMNALVKQATPVNHNLSICDKSLIPNAEDQTYVIYIEGDTTLINLMRCLKLWDVDIRPGHKNSWRFWRGSSHVVIVQCPESIYCKYKSASLPLMKYVPPTKRPRNRRVPR